MKTEELPILSYAEDILTAARYHQVVIVVGTTGSGKTTHIPAIFYKAGYGERGKIACTLPTRPAVITAASFVAQKVQEAVGKTIGYEVRLDRQISGRTRILYLTDGLMLQRLRSDPRLEEFSVIVIDEVHERRQTTDYLLAHVKSLLAVRSDLKVIVSSATLHGKSFSEYFGGAPVINIMARQHPIEIVHRPLRASPYITIAQTVQEFTAKKDDGHVLVFLPGIREIVQSQMAIERLKLKDVRCLPLHGRLSREEQDRVFQAGPGRKVILATNIAETSLTIPGVRYVIDLGLSRQEGVLDDSGVNTLWLKPVSQASAMQRAGRAGRTAPGTCVRLYSQESFAARPAFTLPEVLTGNITGMVLQLLWKGVRHPETLDFLTPLPKSKVDQACQQLLAWDAIDSDRELTLLGKRMVELPLPPQLARMVVLCTEENLAFEAAEVAGFLSVQNITHREGGLDVRINGRHGQFRDPRGDALTFLQLMRTYREFNSDAAWCQSQGIDSRLLQQVTLIRDQVIRRLGWTGVMRPGEMDLESVHRILVRAWGGRLCVYHQNGTYRSGNLYGIHIGKDSSLAGLEPAAFIASDLTDIGECIARYPIAVPESLMDEAVTIYGNPNPTAVPTADGKTLRAFGILRIQTAHARRFVHLDVDCRRSSSRVLRMVKNRSVLFEEASFPIRWLQLSMKTQLRLAWASISTLAELPKTKRELEHLGFQEDECVEVMHMLSTLGYVPKAIQVIEQVLDEEEQPAVASPEGGEPAGDDWLVGGLIKGSLSNLQISRGATMRLLGAGIDTIEKLLQVPSEEVRTICKGAEPLFDEIIARLENFDLRLKSRKEIRQGKWISTDFDPANAVDPARAIAVLGEEDYNLFEGYRASTSYLERVRIRNRLIIKHVGLLRKVGSVAMKQVERRKDRALELADLQQEAVFGAISAIRKFNHRAGFRYSTYALHWMQQAVERMIMDQGAVRIPVHLGEKVNRLGMAVRKFVRINERDPTPEELAEAMSCTVEYVQYLYSLVDLQKPSSLDQPFGGDEDAQSYADVLPQRIPSASEQLSEWQHRRKLKIAVDRIFLRLSLELDQRMIKIFRLRHGLDGDDPMTLEAVGAIYGLTRSRIQQLEAKVLEKFRTMEVWDELSRVTSWLKNPPKDLLEKEQDEELNEEEEPEEEKTQTIDPMAEAILATVAKEYGLTPLELRSQDRRKQVVEARWVIMIQLREQLMMSFPAIAQFLGLSDPTTAVQGCRQGKGLLEEQQPVGHTDTGKE
jgi:RNA polymerase sigma factor (sigma-70 family)